MNYTQRLNRLLDEIFALSTSMTMKEFSVKSKLHVSTLYKLDKRKTRLPRLQTVFLLAKAVGMDIELVAQKVHHPKSKEK